MQVYEDSSPRYWELTVFLGGVYNLYRYPGVVDIVLFFFSLTKYLDGQNYPPELQNQVLVIAKLPNLNSWAKDFMDQNECMSCEGSRLEW